MTDLTLLLGVPGACAAAGLMWAARRRRYCAPSDHLVTVVGRRRLRHGLRKRYWISCRLCDLEYGPYEAWQDAWLDALQAQVTTRRARRTPSPSPTGRPRASRKRTARGLRAGRVR